VQTMKAVRIHQYGGPEMLKYEDAPRPEPAEDEVLVRIHAAAVNPVDWRIRSGSRRQRLKHTFPLILGWDLSGTVARVGTRVKDFGLGDEVYSRPDLLRNGSYAEYIVVREKELAKRPRTLDHVHAAAVPLAALTAWQTLFAEAAIGLSKGQTLLVQGGAGGVGHLAVQLAKWRGARVITTGSTASVVFLHELGADEVIDYTKQRFEDVAHDVDAVFDTLGGEVQARSWRVLRKGGVLASIVSPPSEEEARAHGVRGAYVFVQPSQPQLEELAHLIDDKQLRPVVAKVLPLAEAHAAHELSEGGHVRGKLVLRVRD
jgi:NADPH:quinone reductase-like Zn-dependent oxidoreductase